MLKYETNFCSQNHITSASELAQKSDYHLFKSGVRPEWEDPQNKHGGRWAYTFKNSKANDETWLNIMLAAIGETLQEPDVVGVSVSVKPKEEIISVWNRDASMKPRVGYGTRIIKIVIMLDYWTY